MKMIMLLRRDVAIFLFAVVLSSSSPVIDAFSSTGITAGRGVAGLQRSTTSKTRLRAHDGRRDVDDAAGTDEYVRGDCATDRRDWIVRTGGATLSSLLLMAGGGGVTGVPEVASAASADAVGPGARKTIVMTGANSGIGYEACRRLAKRGHALVLACRTMDRAVDAAERLAKLDDGGAAAVIVPAECDLASMRSIEKFASDLPAMIGGGDGGGGGTTIDSLCLNAGVARNTAATDVARTKDGFELTVGTNHFGHFYLNHLLLPVMNRSSGNIVVTASGVHDPESPGGSQGVPATLGDLRGLEIDGRKCEMIDGQPFNADKAYKDSKLCNVLFTRELQRRLDSKEETNNVIVNCFNPGLIVGTGLFRDQNPVFTKVFDLVATDLFKVGETPGWGGGCLSYMTNAVVTKGAYYGSDPGSSKYGDAAYGKQFGPLPVSKEARDDVKAKRLWDLSEQLLGISS